MLLQAQSKLTPEDYIDMYHEIAVGEMERSGIPASITLAQGILESGNGNSMLATSANNHFGIKCHGWSGKKIYHDDDKRNECFRKYKTPEESFKDHTEFLMNSPRYKSLFELEISDYKGWSRGLKKAGYATSPTYANALIRIIEEYELYKYDKGYLPRDFDDRDRDEKNKTHLVSRNENFSIALGRKEEKNRVDYIITREGDTFKKLAEENELLPGELFKYNELEKDAEIKPGQVLFLQPKRNKASVGNQYHTVKEGETMYSISQDYAIKLKKLYKKNLMEMGEEAKVGQKLWLRKKKKEE